MSKLIPMACLALLGMAGYAWADPAATSANPNSTSASQLQQVNPSATRADTRARDLPTAAMAAHTYTTFGIRYETKL